MTGLPSLRTRASFLALCIAGAVVHAADEPRHSHARPHVHGSATLGVAVQDGRVTIELESPLDSLLGFEHRPRTPAQKQAAQALLDRLDAPQQLFRFDAGAVCTLESKEVRAPTLVPAPTSVPAQESAHADLEATFEFRCRAPARLERIEVGLFDAFSRLQRVDVNVVGADGQHRRRLDRRQRAIVLSR